VEQAIETERAIYDVARPLLMRLRADRRTPARLIGVAASGLVGDEVVQASLFGSESALESERDRALARVRDRLEARFGRDAIQTADQSEKQKGPDPRRGPTPKGR
jgi:hypothetical protein